MVGAEQEPGLDDQAALPRLPRFGLRALLAAVFGFAVLFAVMGKLGLVGSVVLGWFLLLVVAHVLANAWGSRASRRRLRGARFHHPRLKEKLELDQIAGRRTSHLGCRLAPHRATIISTTAAGALAGAVLGMYLLGMAGGAGGAAGWFVGTVSAAILGGLLGFLASSFLGTMSRAVGEAQQELKPPKMEP